MRTLLVAACGLLGLAGCVTDQQIYGSAVGGPVVYSSTGGPVVYSSTGGPVVYSSTAGFPVAVASTSLVGGPLVQAGIGELPGSVVTSQVGSVCTYTYMGESYADRCP